MVHIIDLQSSGFYHVQLWDLHPHGYICTMDWEDEDQDPISSFINPGCQDFYIHDYVDYQDYVYIHTMSTINMILEFFRVFSLSYLYSEYGNAYLSDDYIYTFAL